MVALIANPSAVASETAKATRLAVRVPFQRTEDYRFGNAIADDWEGEVNTWPLDEGLIDYVDAPYGSPTDENEAAVQMSLPARLLRSQAKRSIRPRSRQHWSQRRCMKPMGSKPTWRRATTP